MGARRLSRGAGHQHRAAGPEVSGDEKHARRDRRREHRAGARAVQRRRVPGAAGRDVHGECVCRRPDSGPAERPASGGREADCRGDCHRPCLGSNRRGLHSRARDLQGPHDSRPVPAETGACRHRRRRGRLRHSRQPLHGRDGDLQGQADLLRPWRFLLSVPHVRGARRRLVRSLWSGAAQHATERGGGQDPVAGRTSVVGNDCAPAHLGQRPADRHHAPAGDAGDGPARPRPRHAGRARRR